MAVGSVALLQHLQQVLQLVLDELEPAVVDLLPLAALLRSVLLVNQGEGQLDRPSVDLGTPAGEHGAAAGQQLKRRVQ